MQKFPHSVWKYPSLLLVSVLFSVSAFLLVSGFIAKAQEKDEDTSVKPASSPDPGTIPHTLVGSYYTLENNIDAKLLLNNKGIAQLEVQPTLYNAQGQGLQLPPVYVEPKSARFIDLADWAAIGGPSFQSGNIKLFHYGRDLSYRRS
jgi:hypothetical protein